MPELKVALMTGTGQGIGRGCAIEMAKAGYKVSLMSPSRRSVDLAKELEAAFLSEMLKAAKLGETPQEFGGGIGEDQFASFMRDAQARAMVDAGGIGLAEQLFKSLTKGQGNGSS